MTIGSMRILCATQASSWPRWFYSRRGRNVLPVESVRLQTGGVMCRQLHRSARHKPDLAACSGRRRWRAPSSHRGLPLSYVHGGRL